MLMLEWFYSAGIEARGFMFGPAIALGIGAKFVPLRKPKKLPGIIIIIKLLNFLSFDSVYGVFITF